MRSCSTSAPSAGPTCPTQRKDDHIKGDEAYFELKGYVSGFLDCSNFMEIISQRAGGIYYNL